MPANDAPAWSSATDDERTATGASPNASSARRISDSTLGGIAALLTCSAGVDAAMPFSRANACEAADEMTNPRGTANPARVSCASRPALAPERPVSSAPTASRCRTKSAGPAMGSGREAADMFVAGIIAFAFFPASSPARESARL